MMELDGAPPGASGMTKTRRPPRSDSGAAVLLQLSREEQRVKVYRLDRETQAWGDCGTGFFELRGECKPIGDGEGEAVDPETLRFHVSATDNERTLLETPLRRNSDFFRPRLSMITWLDSDGEYNALSFQSPECARGAWATVRDVMPPESISENRGSGEDTTGDESDSGLSDDGGLAHPTADNVADFAAQLAQVEVDMVSIRHEELNVLLRGFTHESWLRSLWTVLHTASARGDLEVCGAIAELLARIVTLYTMAFNPFVTSTETGQQYSIAPRTGASFDADPEDPLVVLLADRHYSNFFRAMEFESEMNRHGVRIPHAEFLERVQFRKVLNIPDPLFVSTARFLYRLLYLRDVCLPRLLDEATMQRLTILTNSGYAYICRVMVEQVGAFQTLKSMIPEDVMAARFLNQVLSVFKLHLTGGQERAQVFAQIRQAGLLEALEGYLTGDCNAVRRWEEQTRSIDHIRSTAAHVSALSRSKPDLLNADKLSVSDPVTIAVEVLHLACEASPNLLRLAIANNASANEEQSPTLWFALAALFESRADEGSMVQAAEIFRHILNPATMDDPQRDDFLSLFYDKGIVDKLIDVLLDPKPTSNGKKHVAGPQEATWRAVGKRQICDILSFCVRQHHYRMKYKVLQRNLPQSILAAAQAPFDSFLALYAVKFMKACVAQHADFYHRHFTKNDVLGAALRLLLRRCCRDAKRGQGSVLEAAILDLFSAICAKSQISLIAHLLENHATEIDRLDHHYRSKCAFRLFERLKLQYAEHTAPEKSHDTSQTTAAPPRAFRSPLSFTSRKQQHRSHTKLSDEEVERELEDAYFQNSSDEEEEAPRDAEVQASPPTCEAEAEGGLRVAPPAVSLQGPVSFSGLRLVNYADDDEEDDDITNSPLMKRPKLDAFPTAPILKGTLQPSVGFLPTALNSPRRRAKMVISLRRPMDKDPVPGDSGP